MAQRNEAGLPAGPLVHGDLVNLTTYGIYGAITELYGDRGWDVVYRSGEIIFEELRRQLNITETEPLAVARRVTQWLVDVGYAGELTVSQPEEDRIVYELDNVVVGPGVFRLMEEKERPVLPHWSSAILIAALRQMCGIEAEMDDTRPERITPTRAREHWKLRRL